MTLLNFWSTLISGILKIPMLIGFFGGLIIFILALGLIIVFNYFTVTMFLPFILDFIYKLKRQMIYRIGFLLLAFFNFLLAKIIGWIFPFIVFDIVGVIYYIIIILIVAFTAILYTLHFGNYCCCRCNKWSHVVTGTKFLRSFVKRNVKEIDTVEHTTYADTSMNTSKVVKTETFVRDDEYDEYEDTIVCTNCFYEWKVERTVLTNMGKEVKRFF
ncbi:MAG: hypothetical protein RBR48_04625 [Bacilli bacterium]|jgi:hypothetical protein|nr:hypothetical protein [Bacilli bacterium]MDD4056950.1 hypothetical protein [Bacilli bacterium]MDY0209446.1 hypothetical protein [Bacilli bacterium]